MNKMFLKNLIFLGFLFYVFNLKFSIQDELNELIGVNPFSEDYKTRICNLSVNLWAGLCEVSIKYLRSSVYEYSNLYVNYVLFNNSSQKCDSVTIRYANGMEVTGTVLHCYGRPSVVQDNVLPLHYKHFKEIAIVPVVNVPSAVYPIVILNIVTVFKREENADIYFPFAEHKLSNPRMVSNDVLRHPPPTSVMTYVYDDFAPTYSNNRFEDCFNETNVLKTIGLNEFIKLCVWMFGQERFKSEFIVSSNPNDYKRGKRYNKNIVQIKTSYMEGAVITHVYTCKGQYIGPINSAITNMDYVLALTNLDDRVMLCKSIRVPDRKYSHLHALEIVKNLDKDYLEKAP